MRLQFRGEFFNLLNRVNLGNPNTNLSSAQFGRITSAGSPRVIQLAARLTELLRSRDEGGLRLGLGRGGPPSSGLDDEPMGVTWLDTRMTTASPVWERP